MKIQDIFEIAYSVKLSGISNENQLVRTFFMRSGKRLPFSKILELYNEILRVVKSFGYSDVFDFLNDYFPNENFEKIRVYNKNLNLKLAISNTLQSPPVESVILSPIPKVSSPVVEEPKISPVQMEKNEATVKEVSVKPIKIFREALKDYKNKEIVSSSKIIDNVNSQSKDSSILKESLADIQVKEGSINDVNLNSNELSKSMSDRRDLPSEYEVTPKDKARINKYKKLSKKFREMDAKEKELDNRYDYLMHHSKVDQNIKTITDNRNLLEDNPFTGKLYDDLDLEFRMVMFKIYKLNKNKIKDKSNYNEEIDFLEKYFCKKLHIVRKDDDAVKKLANAVAYLMKKLQNKIFDTEDSAIIESMLYFKTKLYLFYNYYRK